MMQDDYPDSPQDVFVQSLVMVDETTGIQEVHICVGGPDVDRIKDAVLAAFQAAVDEHLRRPEFGGEIHIAVLSEVTPQTAALWHVLTDLEEHLSTVIRAGNLRAVSGQPVHISVEFTEGTGHG